MTYSVKTAAPIDGAEIFSVDIAELPESNPFEGKVRRHEGYEFLTDEQYDAHFKAIRPWVEASEIEEAAVGKVRRHAMPHLSETEYVSLMNSRNVFPYLHDWELGLAPEPSNSSDSSEWSDYTIWK